VRPFLAGSVLVLVLVSTRALLLGLVFFKKAVVAMLERKVELEEEKGREGKVILGLEEKDRVTDEISMAFWVSGFGGWSGKMMIRWVLCLDWTSRSSFQR
jgi:hypothetical protein